MLVGTWAALGMATLQLCAISTGFTNNINNSEPCMALELHSEGTPLHRLPSPPPMDSNWAPVRQWKAREWEDQLGSDPSGFVTSGKPFWKSSLLCCYKPQRAYLQTFVFRFIYLFFLHNFCQKGGLRDDSDHSAVELLRVAEPPEVCAFFHDSNTRTLLRLDYALRE